MKAKQDKMASQKPKKELRGRAPLGGHAEGQEKIKE